jgi:hypothetical protein
VERVAPDGRQRILAVFNFMSQPQTLPLQGEVQAIEQADEVLGETDVVIKGGYLLLPPYAGYWFVC